MSQVNIMALALVVIGWAFNLGILWQMSRNHGDKLKSHDQDIKDIRGAMISHHESNERHTSIEWRAEMREWMQKVENKLDAIQVNCTKRLLDRDC